MEKYTNDLIHESSPYLLQHAHNPVNWVAWSPEVFERAQREGKLVLISVGYSACHWCHVMEHECFEDEEVATIMNKHFINVKVDREERPDVDQVYMTAVQLMTQQGGWPLNCFTTPDGRPIHGGTYFPKEQWMHVLKSLHHTFVNAPEKVEEFARNVHEGVVKSELITVPAENVQFEKSKVEELVLRWAHNFDAKEGGNSRAPKFPMPNNLDFLLDYGLRSGKKRILEHVELTLDKMALGGIYDQIGGGFARYSVDMLWKVPHFEKMLYDNGQLLSTYSKAYRYFKKPLYERTVKGIVHWLIEEMTDISGAFYSALDADSEGVEGKFYVWKKEELMEAAGSLSEFAKSVYALDSSGYWEDGNYILLRRKGDVEVCKELGLSTEDFEQKLEKLNRRLVTERAGKIRPGLDDKCLTGWNALTITGLCSAFEVFGDEDYLHLAQRCSNWLLKQQFTEDGKLFRTYKNGTSKVSGFLEDYATVIEAMIAMYRITTDENYLEIAKKLTERTLSDFHDEQSGMFFFTSSDTELIARKMEMNDNVIPASNSIMARNLQVLSVYFRNEAWKVISDQMLANVYDGMEHYGSGYSNWGILLNSHVYRFNEVFVSGADARKKWKTLLKENAGEFIGGASELESKLPVFGDKKPKNPALIYVCQEGACSLPTESVEDALEELSKAIHG